MTSTTASAIRPGLRDNRTLSGSPHTPSRFISSNYSSPGSTFRQEEDAVIFQLDPRRICAGFEGQSSPQCSISLGSRNSRRVGDYRTWLPDYKRVDVRLENEIKAQELWRNDLTDVDLGLLEDKLERAVREVYTKYLLTDAGTARLILVLPSLVPLPVISSILTTLFERWKYSTITLLPTPTMAVVAAAVRSALVVELGWEETIITPIYEYRELTASRTTRAMKMLTFKTGEKLRAIAANHTDGEAPLRQDLEFIEDFIRRVVFCEPTASASGTEISNEIQQLSIEDERHGTDTISIEWPTDGGSFTIPIARSEISQLVSDCFFEQHPETCNDDHETALHQLLFRCLLGLPPDVRGICMSRIIFTGTEARVPGLQERALDELQVLITTHGWTAVRGQHVNSRRHGLAEIAQGRSAPPDARHNSSLPAGEDYVEEKLQKQHSKALPSGSQGTLRAIDSLGPWVGASLLASVKVRSAVEIERERFLSHGISGATRDNDLSVVSQRTSSLGAGITKGTDRSSWTLGGWG